MLILFRLSGFNDRRFHRLDRLFAVHARQEEQQSEQDYQSDQQKINASGHRLAIVGQTALRKPRATNMPIIADINSSPYNCPCRFPSPAPPSIGRPMRSSFPSSAPLAPDRPLVLVGLMGVGKTTVGKRLAAKLGLQFVDADAEIEKAADMSIPDIFDRYGESGFRDGERRVIARLLSDKPMVLATGGGAFMNDETRALIMTKGLAIWLDADIAILADRVSRRDTRPLLSGKNPVEVLTDLAAKRNPVYAEAHIHVKSNCAPHEETVKAIMEELARWLA